MDFGKIVDENPWIFNVANSLVAIVIAIVLYLIIVNILIHKIEKKYNAKIRNKKYSTYVKLLKSIIRYVILIVLAFCLLKINGVNITAMVAGVGVFGIIFGFAIQDALKDVIKGIDIITDS